MADANPEIVIHMAAQPLVRFSYANPIETYATNVMGTINVLESIRSLTCVRAAVIVKPISVMKIKVEILAIEKTSPWADTILIVVVRLVQSW